MKPNIEQRQGAVAASGLLGLDDVAALLGVAVVAVRRLIALGLLAATLIGKPDQNAAWRIIGSVAADYIRGGATRFAMPAVAGSWFKQQPGAACFLDAMIAACADQVPEQAPDIPEGQSVRLRVTPAVSRLCLSAPQASLLGSPISGLPDWRCCYLIERLHIEARRIIAKPTTTEGELSNLYRSPERFQQVLGEATRVVLAGRIAFSKDYLVKAPNGGQAWKVVQFVFPHSQLVDAGGVTLKSVQTLAF